MHLPINVKYPNNISKWHMGINSVFKVLKYSAHEGSFVVLLCYYTAYFDSCLLSFGNSLSKYQCKR
jgi:hypothetical protein